MKGHFILTPDECPLEKKVIMCIYFLCFLLTEKQEELVELQWSVQPN